MLKAFVMALINGLIVFVLTSSFAYIKTKPKYENFTELTNKLVSTNVFYIYLGLFTIFSPIKRYIETIFVLLIYFALLYCCHSIENNSRIKDKARKYACSDRAKELFEELYDKGCSVVPLMERVYQEGYKQYGLDTMKKLENMEEKIEKKGRIYMKKKGKKVFRKVFSGTDVSIFLLMAKVYEDGYKHHVIIL